MRHHEIIIIGAGISGLAAASRLAAQGRDVMVLDKSRGVSGRAATRRWAGSRVDHGAQFFTARSENFQAQVRAWKSKDVCFEWAKGFHEWRDDALFAPTGESHTRYACADGMSALGKSMAHGVNVQTGYQVRQVQRTPAGWKISADDNMDEFSADILIVSAPAVQALSWLDADIEPDLQIQLKSIQYGPSICVVLRGVLDAPEWRGIQIQSPHPLSWMADDTSRRREHSPVRNLVLHGSADFSAGCQDRDLEEAADRLVQAAATIAGDRLLSFTERMVHYWRYAVVTQGLRDQMFLSSRSGPPLFFCGDAFAGAKIEGAWLSGDAVAGALSREGKGI